MSDASEKATNQGIGANVPDDVTKPSSWPKGQRTFWLVIWWMSKTPHIALFDERVAAEAAANVRNAFMVQITGTNLKVGEALDWYRRDEGGHPMPAEWRDLLGQIHVPWAAHPQPGVKLPGSRRI